MHWRFFGGHKARIDFADAVHIFLDNNRIEREDYRVGYGEQRFQTIGSSEYGILFVIYTEREPDGTIRLISASKVNKQVKLLLQRQISAGIVI
ncbi:BrnT family toxin [Litoribrevibacter euphylliae]|uniref:BrnT family toxin n=1 Tax=Litoribrevibacter euphylliae TaxID=1834034 RepID=A0ABV7HBY0_9GAMM